MWTKHRRDKRKKEEGETVSQLDFSGSKPLWSAAFRLVEEKTAEGEEKVKIAQISALLLMWTFRCFPGKARII